MCWLMWVQIRAMYWPALANSGLVWNKIAQSVALICRWWPPASGNCSKNAPAGFAREVLEYFPSFFPAALPAGSNLASTVRAFFRDARCAPWQPLFQELLCEFQRVARAPPPTRRRPPPGPIQGGCSHLAKTPYSRRCRGRASARATGAARPQANSNARKGLSRDRGSADVNARSAPPHRPHAVLVASPTEHQWLEHGAS